MQAFALNCTLKPSPEPSSTDLLLDQIGEELARSGIELKRARVADAHVRAGVSADEGAGDAWPELRNAILEAELFVLATPIWLGHPSSHAQRVLERLDAFLRDTDDRGQMATVDRVAMVAVVGNEDGAHHVGAELFQGLNDVGFTLAANAMTYWVGEAMGSVDYRDLPGTPPKTAQTTSTMVANAVHLARRLQAEAYPSLDGHHAEVAEVTDQTIRTEREDAFRPHLPDDMPTPEEEAKAEASASLLTDEARAAYRSQIERGARVKGEGEIP